MTHLWAGLSWHNVWDLPYDVWCLYALNADEWLKATVTRGGL